MSTSSPNKVVTSCDIRANAIRKALISSRFCCAFNVVLVLILCVLAVAFVDWASDHINWEIFNSRVPFVLLLIACLYVLAILASAAYDRIALFRSIVRRVVGIFETIHKWNGSIKGAITTLLVSYGVVALIVAVATHVPNESRQLFVLFFCVALVVGMYNMGSIASQLSLALIKKAKKIEGSVGKILERTLFAKVEVRYELQGEHKTARVLWVKAIFIYLGLCWVVSEAESDS